MTHALAAPFTRIQGFLHGYLQTGGNNGQMIDMLVAVAPATIRRVIAVADAGGTGTVLDVRINGTSVWTNPADRPTLAGGAGGRFLSGRINRSAIQPGDVVSLVMVQAGNKTNLAATVALEDPGQRMAGTPS